jgi:hypothetical protein
MDYEPGYPTIPTADISCESASGCG